MSSVHIEKAREGQQSPLPVFEALERMANETRRRAFDLFQSRGTSPGSDMDDWFRAEREIQWFPPAELIEDESQFSASPGGAWSGAGQSASHRAAAKHHCANGRRSPARQASRAAALLRVRGAPIDATVRISDAHRCRPRLRLAG